MSRLVGQCVETPGVPPLIRSGALSRGVSQLAEAQEVQSATARIVWRVLRMLSRLDGHRTQRILLIEPDSAALGRALRASGFLGERWALFRPSRLATDDLATGYDHLHVLDWLDPLVWPDTTRRTTALNSPNVADLGLFEAVIGCNILRWTPSDRWGSLLSSLGALLMPRGCLVLSEPVPPTVVSRHIEPPLAEAGLLLAADHESVQDTWPRVVATFQNRGQGEGRLVGVLQPLTREQAETSAALPEGLVAAYREAFGGHEWREWARCARPGCGRHYDRLEVAAMDPPGQCTCGWAAPLLPFHTTDTVLAKLRRELADEASSCCFIHHDPIGRVDGFAWGYLTGVQGTAQALLPERRQSSARKLLRARLRRLVQEPVSPGAEIADAPAPIFYLSELGVVERARSFSLARALFHRTLQFADDHGASVALLRTSPHANAYALLIGVEMQVVYRYNEPLQERVQGSAKTASNEQSEQDTDERVVLAGDVRQMLHIFNGESDRRLAWRIAHRLRQQRTLPDPLSLEDWGERR